MESKQLTRGASMAGADREWRSEQQRVRREGWGERHPGATDWMRRDAGEAMWQQRERAGYTAAYEGAELDDDWRIGEFDEMIDKENSMRKAVYKWWLRIWDANMDDHMFDDEPPSRDWDTRYARSGTRDGARGGSSTRAGWSDDDAWRDDPYGGDDDDAAAYGGGGGAWDEPAPPPRRRARSPERRMEDAIDVSVAELLDDEELEPPRRRAAPPERLQERERERERDPVAPGGASAASDEDSWVRDMRRDLEAWGVDSDGGGAAERRSGAAGGGSGGGGGGGGVGGSRVEYVAARLAKLADGVHTRLETLQAEDDDLSARYDKVSTYRRQLQSQTPNGPVDGDGGGDGDGDEPPQPLQNNALTARETDLARLSAVSSQLRKRRTALWEALDTAQERADELARARRALRSDGLRGLRELVVRRKVSRNLATYLERLLGPLY